MRTKIKIVCNLRTLMERDGIKQVDVVRDIGATKQQVSRWRLHGEIPHVGYVLRMHDKYGWTLREMFEEKEE